MASRRVLETKALVQHPMLGKDAACIVQLQTMGQQLSQETIGLWFEKTTLEGPAQMSHGLVDADKPHVIADTA